MNFRDISGRVSLGTRNCRLDFRGDLIQIQEFFAYCLAPVRCHAIMVYVFCRMVDQSIV